MKTKLSVPPRSTVTITIDQIKDLAQFAGFDVGENITDAPDDTGITIELCPEEWVIDDDGKRRHYQHIAYLDEYPEEGCYPLGDPISPAKPRRASATRQPDSKAPTKSAGRKPGKPDAKTRRAKQSGLAETDAGPDFYSLWKWLGRCTQEKLRAEFRKREHLQAVPDAKLVVADFQNRKARTSEQNY